MATCLSRIWGYYYYEEVGMDIGVRCSLNNGLPEWGYREERATMIPGVWIAGQGGSSPRWEPENERVGRLG